MGFFTMDMITSKKYPGVYYRESKRGKKQGKPDKIFWVFWYADGKKHRLRIGNSSQGITEEYANRRRIDILNKIHLGENPDLTLRKKPTLDYIVAAYFAWREAEGKHIKEDQCRYNLHVAQTIGSAPPASLTSHQIDAIRSEIINKMASSSAKKVFILLRAAVNFAIKKKMHIGTNPFSSQGNFAMPKEDNKGERFLTPSEATALLNELEKRSTQLYHMAFIALHTGMRSAEIFRIKGADIHENESIAIITAKGGNRETVFLPKEVIPILVSYRTTHDALLFPDRNGEVMNEIPNTFDRAVNAIGLNDTGNTYVRENGTTAPVRITDKRYKVWFHTLRHTFASWLAQSGKVTLHELMKIMRHNRIETTMRYAHLIPSQQHEKVSLISDILSGHSQGS